MLSKVYFLFWPISVYERMYIFRRRVSQNVILFLYDTRENNTNLLISKLCEILSSKSMLSKLNWYEPTDVIKCLEYVYIYINIPCKFHFLFVKNTRSGVSEFTL